MLRTCRAAILTLFLLIVLPSQAAEAMTVHADPQVPRSRFYQTWSDRSIMPTPDITLKVIPWDDRCSAWDVAGCSLIGFSDENVMVIKKRRPYGISFRFLFLHEVGHFFDYLYLTDENRRWIMNRLRIRGPWARQAVETFAEVYALCATTPERRMWFRAMTAPIWVGTPRQIIRVCRYTRLIYRRGMLAEPSTAPFEGYDG